MAIRGARVLVAGACTPAGERVVEAFLALGAHVVAADGLRTRLEELRGRLRQHERLWVAECDLGDLRAANALFRDVARDEPIDVALIAIPSAPAPDAFTADPAAVREALAAVPRCIWFLRAALDPTARAGRVIVVLENASSELDRALHAAVSELVMSANEHGQALGIAVCGLASDLSQAAALEHLVMLADPVRPAARGWRGRDAELRSEPAP